MRLSGWVLVGALACLIGCGDDSSADEPASCPECECEEYCVQLCELVDLDCGGTSVRACTEGCFEFEPSICPIDSLLVRDCALLDNEASCYEALASPHGDCTSSSGIPPGLCHPDNDFGCNSGAYCDADTMLCVPGCRMDEECSPGQFCDTETMQCAEGCSDDFDCERPDVCNLESHMCEPKACTEVRDCGLDFTCNLANQRCEICSPDNCDGVCDQFGRCFECVETTDCAPTHECRSNVCRQRCNASVPCEAGRVCYADLCSDPVGAPCDPEDFSSCFGGSCLDDDASLMTVEPYCAPMCTFDLGGAMPALTCPEGYQCDGLDCVRQ
jgi:hypothetical protein